MTVPSRMLRLFAASLYDRPATSTATSTSRKSGGSEATAA